MKLNDNKQVNSEASSDLETHINSIKGGGWPLPESVRAFFEPRFGYNFNQVRVHTDSKAAESARMLNAQAFTVGRDIVFGKGEYAPETRVGGQLLSHELTHVIQQQSHSGFTLQRSGDHSCREGEGPPAIEPDPENKGPHPLIYRGVTKKRSRRPAVGDAQQLLNHFLEELKKGNFKCEAGADMEEIQRIRNRLTQYPLEVDCRFGPNTYLATVMFQRCVFPKHPVEWDGKIGPKTWPLLDKLRISPPPVPTPQPPTTPPPPSPTGLPFLDLQIACVTDKGGCTNPSNIPTFDANCRTETGYTGAPLLHSDLECSTHGMAIAKSLNRAYPGWLGILPNCPCTRAEAEKAKNFSRDLYAIIAHPDADACYRSDAVESVPGTSHSQQCCYMKSGILLTSGSSAGNPDVWRPGIPFTKGYDRHKRIDVQPYHEIGNYLTYQKYWVPNKGVSCPAADPCQNRCEWEFENCIKKGDGLSCIAYRQSCYAKCGP